METPREFTIHPLINEDGYFAIDDDFGGSMFLADSEIPIIIDLLTRYQQGQHDGPRHLFRDCDMTVEEVAKTYGIQPGTVRVTIHKGWIKARKSGKSWLIKLSEAERRWGGAKKQNFLE
jgi:excisionase family DNA binding protein